MRRKDLDYVVIAAMLVSGLYVTVSGLIADVFGFPRFLLHPLAGYVCGVLALLHLGLNWRQVTAYLRRRLGRRARPVRERETQPREHAPACGRRALLASALGAAGGFALGRLIPRQQPTEFSAGGVDVGEAYHEWSKPGHSLSLGLPLDWGSQPERIKTYRDAERIALPDPLSGRGSSPVLSLKEAIEARRSRRTYAAGSLSLEELSRLLHGTCGITDARGFRAAPSAGALYPIETYAVVHDVDGLSPGLYHYAVPEHALERLRTGDLRAELIVAGLGQDMLGRAQVCLVFSAIFQRTRWRYRERTYRYVLLEAGHIGQNVYLAATAMGLGACAVGAFLDGNLNRLLGVDGTEEAALYILAVGKV